MLGDAIASKKQKTIIDSAEIGTDRTGIPSDPGYYCCSSSGSSTYNAWSQSIAAAKVLYSKEVLLAPLCGDSYRQADCSGKTVPSHPSHPTYSSVTVTVLLGTTGYFEVLLGTYGVLLGTYGVLLGTLRYFWVL